MAILFKNKKKNQAAAGVVADSEPSSEVTVPAEETASELIKESKPVNRRRCVEMKFRLAPEEKEELDALAAQARMSRTDFLIASMRSVPMIIFPGADQIMRELRRQGTNLNQLAKVANANGDIETLEELQQLMAEGLQLRALIRDSVEHWNARVLKVNLAKEGEDSADRQDESIESSAG